MKPSFALRSAMVAVACVVPLLTSSPASAAPLTPLERCTNGQVPSADVTITHPGGTRSVGYPNVADQPNIIYPGDAFAIYSSGSISIDYWGNSYGPGGKSGDYAGAEYPFPGMPKYSSVIRFNNNPAGWVGNPDLTVNWAGCNSWTSSYPVRVGFIVNDTGIGDNGGQWSYRILHYKR